MIRNRDDADVGRSIRAFRHHADVARRELTKVNARIAPVKRVHEEGGPQSRNVAGPTLYRLQRRAALCRTELRFWLGAIDRILEMHADQAARNPGWLIPLAHDPTNDNKQGIAV